MERTRLATAIRAAIGTDELVLAIALVLIGLAPGMSGSRPRF